MNSRILRTLPLAILVVLAVVVVLGCGESLTPAPQGRALGEPDADERAAELPPVDEDEPAPPVDEQPVDEANDESDDESDDQSDDESDDEVEDGAEPEPPAPSDESCTADGWCREAPSLASGISSSDRLRGVYAFAEDDAWAVGDAGLIARRDAAGWSVWPSGTERDLHDVWGSAPDDVWAVGGKGWPTDPLGVLMRFDGVAWLIVVDDAPATLRAVWGAAPDDVWAGGEGLLMHFDGAGWTVHDESLGLDISDVWGRAQDDVWAVGSWGKTLHFDGSAWSEVSTGQEAGLTAVHGAPDTATYLLGGNGLLFVLDDGAWVQLGSYETETFFALWVSSLKGAVAVGTNAAIRRFSADTFVAEDAGTDQFLLDVVGIDAERAFAVGFGGTILRRRP